MAKSKDLITKFDVLSLMSLGRKKSLACEKYARFNRRMIAGTLDTMLLMFLAPIFNILAPIDISALGTFGDSPESARVSSFVSHMLHDRAFVESWLMNTMLQVLVFFTYSAICWHFWSATPGKMLVRIKIVDVKTEKPISDKQIALRLAVYILSGLVFVMGFFWIGIDKKGRAWHDLIAGTAVVTIPWRKKKKIDLPLTSQESELL